MYTLDKDNKIVESKDVTDLLPELREYSINTTMPIVRDWDSYIDGATAVTNYQMSRAGNYISVVITPTKGFVIKDISVYVDDREHPYYIPDSELVIEEDGYKRIVHFSMPSNNVDVECTVDHSIGEIKKVGVV